MHTLALDSGLIRIDEHDALLHATLARPDKLNALTRSMYADLSRIVEHVADRDDLHALLLDGEGRAFCAGNDIADFAHADPQATGGDGVGIAIQFIHMLRALNKPVVMAVQGNATGIGTTMLLHSDLVVAADSARFNTAFIDLGLVPEAGSSMLLPQLVGHQNAARLLLAGDHIDADEAQRMGLIAYRCDDDELPHKALAVATALAAKAPAAVQQTKRLMRADGDTLQARIDRESELFAERLFSDDVRALFARFLDADRS